MFDCDDAEGSLAPNRTNVAELLQNYCQRRDNQLDHLKSMKDTQCRNWERTRRQQRRPVGPPNVPSTDMSWVVG